MSFRFLSFPFTFSFPIETFYTPTLTQELAKQLQEKEELKAKKLREKLQQEQQQRQRAAQEAEAPASTTSPTGSNPTLFAYRPPTAIQAKEGAAPGEAVPVTRQNYKRGSTTRKK